MELLSIPTGNFKLDGGAMHGVVPKSMWNKFNPADENNMCSWSMRCMLISSGARLILIDNGIGDKQDEKFLGYYFLHGDDSLDRSLNAVGISKDDITDVFLTHLHFDHCGGSVINNKSGDGYETAFKNATYWSNSKHWEWAVNPNAREKASFLKENILPIQESGQLNFFDQPGEFIPGMEVKFFHGHTESMMIPVIDYKGQKVAFMADLLPSAGHIPVPFVMAYDTRPLITLDEKAQFLKEASDNNYVLFFEHDKQRECCTLKWTDKGARIDRELNLNDL